MQQEKKMEIIKRPEIKEHLLFQFVRVSCPRLKGCILRRFKSSSLKIDQTIRKWGQENID
jgi:hypothetical protein